MIQEQLNSVVEKSDLLKSKFYQAWSAGTLPVSALRTYAEEYGAFISLLPLGWESQGDLETAEEEQEHIELWQDFAAALETSIGECKVPGVSHLMETAQSLFGDPITALGALYAFEVQQPATASSKLEGLRAHYSLDKKVEPYFIEHSKNHHEAEKLIRRISALSAENQERALSACEAMSKALLAGLDGIYTAHKAEMPAGTTVC